MHLHQEGFVTYRSFNNRELGCAHLWGAAMLRPSLPGLSVVAGGKYGIAGRNFSPTDKLREVVDIG